MASFGVYSSKRVLITYDNIAVIGLAEGTFVKVMQTKPSFVPSMGGDGDGCFVLDADESGAVEFTLHHASPSAAALMAKAKEQRNTLRPGAAIVRDLNGTFLGQVVGFLEKPADTERGSTTNNQTWKVVSLKVEQEGGGLLPTA